MTLHHFKRRSLVVERLENRDVLAGDVLAVIYGQMLVIWGDEQANGVTLTYDSTTQVYHVVGKEVAGEATTINGQDTSLPENVPTFNSVKNVAVILHGGDDQFAVGSPQAVDTVINQWLAIDMGDGNDQVVLGQAGNAAGGADPVALSLRTGTSVTVDLGAGDDELNIANADIGLALNIYAGDGSDDVTFATEFTPADPAQQSLFPVRVRGNCNIVLGGGEDELAMHNATIRGHLIIADWAGPAHLDLFNLSIGKKLDIDTAGDNDEIAIQFVSAKQFTLDSNSGIDDVDITDCRFRTVTIKLGDAHDDLLLRRVRVSLFTHLDGGSGGSSLVRGPGNKLTGLTKRHIG